MTSLTVTTALLLVFGLIRPDAFGYALALGGVTAAGAAFTAGGIAVPTFFAVAVGAAAILAGRSLRPGLHPATPRVRLPPGVALLLVFLGWVSLVTLLAPQLFAGQTVLSPRGPAQLISGHFSSSNLAQTTYVVLGICVVVYLARARVAGPGVLGLAVGGTVVLSFWRYLHEGGLPFPEGFFDNSPTLAFIETAAGGGERFRGILSEPSSLGASCLVGFSYMVSRAWYVSGVRRVGCLVVAVLAAFMGSISTSTSFIVASVVVVAVGSFVALIRILGSRVNITAGVVVSLCVLAVVALWLLPVLSSLISAAVDSKVASTSFDERSTADATSYDIFFDTYGLGVGLGANRASSFVAGLLSTAGLVGTLLFLATVMTLIFKSLPARDYRPVMWALISLLILKAIAGPDLSDPSGVLWLSIGLLSRAASMTRTPGRDAASEPLGTPVDVRRRPAGSTP